MKHLAAAILLLVFAHPSHAQVRVKGAAVYKPYDPIVLKVSELTSAKAQFLWDVSEGAQCVEAGDVCYIWAPPGAYKVQLIAIDFDTKKVERARFAFTVSGDVPIPPIPPDPKPPVPPDPKPTPVAGLKVLILFDSKLKTTYSDKTLDILHGQEMADWFNKNCSSEKALGYGKAWAVWPAATAVTDKMPKFWRDGVERGRPKATGAKGPWMIVADGADKVVWEGELPPDVPQAIALLSRFVPKTLRKAG